MEATVTVKMTLHEVEVITAALKVFRDQYQTLRAHASDETVRTLDQRVMTAKKLSDQLAR